jgi:cytochrome c-type biogenesis protein CcmE
MLNPAQARKRRRMIIVALAAVILAVAAALVVNALRDTVVFFHSPSEVQARLDDAKFNLRERRFRIGGLVEVGSVHKMADGTTMEFRVSDGAQSLAVRYTGLVPDLFREGQGVVAQGRLGADGVFAADEILAKHDENYMPPEVADALKKSGHWHPDGQGPHQSDVMPSVGPGYAPSYEYQEQP